MAERADGTVYINSKLDTSGFKPGAKEINAALKKTAETMSKVGDSMSGYSQEVMKFVNEYVEGVGKAGSSNNEFLKEIEKAKATLEDLEKQGKWFGDEDYDKAVLNLERLEKAAKDYKKELLSPTPDANPFGLDTMSGKIVELENQMKKLIEAGKGLGDPAYDEVYRKLALAKDAAKQYAAELAKTPAQIQKEADALAAKEAKAEAARQKNESRINAELQKMEQLRAKEVEAALEADRLKAIGDNAEISDQHIVDLNNELQRLKERQADLNKAGVGGLGFTEFEQNAARIAEIEQELRSYQSSLSDAEKTTVRFSDRLKRAFSGALSVVKKAAVAMLLFHKNTKKSNSSIGSSIKNMLKYTLGIGGLVALLRKIKSAVKEGMQNLAQYPGETNTHLSALKSSMTQLKNSLATAFNPILTVIEPILTRFINLLSQAATYVGMFFAALTGQKSFTKAVAVQEDYAASLGATADNAKKAQKYLSGLDEVRTYSEDKDTSAGGNGSVDPSQMFETVDIPGFVGDWIQKFKDAWNNADLSEIGSVVGGNLKNALEIMPWESIKATCNNIAQSLATFINGFVATPRLWETVGVSIGEGVNTAVGMWNTFFDVANFIAIGGAIAKALNNAFQTIDATELGRALSQKIRALIEAAYGFVTEFDWSGFGTWLGEAVNGFFDNIDFALAAQTLGQGIIGALNGITAFIQEVDWYGLGQKVKEFLVNIDWGGICSAMFEAIGAALAGLALFIWGVIEDAWNSVVDWWHDVAFEDGQFTISGLLNGIWEAIKNIGAWIKEHIFDPFINGFKSVFGIASPSTVMEEQGNFIMEGLFNGISSLIENVVSLFTDIKDSVIDVWEQLEAKTSEIWVGIQNFIKESVNSIIGFINGLISGIVAGINTMINALNSLHFDIPDWIPAIGGKSFGFSIPAITAPQIPYLATGAVIPPNAPFMAVLGDQKHGTNIEAPLSLIEDSVNRAVRNAMGNQQQRNGTYIFEAQLDRRTIFRQVIEEAKLRQAVTGRNPFELA